MIAITNAKILTMAEPGHSVPVAGYGTVLIEGRGITAAGDAAVPRGAEVIDASGKTLTPGLVDAHTHIGVASQGYPESDQDCNEMMSGVTPHARVIDAINPADEAFLDALSGGVTCVQILPGSANTIGGQGAIVKTPPDVADRMVVRAPSSIKAAFGENPKNTYQGSTRWHFTRMGNAAIMREALTKAVSYRRKKTHAVAGGDFCETDLALEALGLALDGNIPIAAHAHRADDIVTAIRIFEEFGVRYTLEHCTEGHLIADWLAEKKAMAAVGPALTEKSKLELRNKSWSTPAELHAAGVHVCIITDHGVVPIEHLRICAALAAAAGLPYMEALKAVTIYGAQHIGMGDRIGSIEAGKDADVVIWSGDPLEINSSAEIVIVNGRIVRRML